MAKILKSSRKKDLLIKRISDLEYRKTLGESYLEVYESKLKQRKDRKLEALKRHLDDGLFDYELNTLSNEDYQKVKTQAAFEKLDKKLYWKKREITQKYKRRANKESTDVLEALTAEDIRVFEEKIDNDKENLSKKYSRFFTNTEISNNKKLYNEKLEESKIKLDQLENEINKFNKTKLEDLTQKTKLKNEAIQAKISKLTSDLNNLTKKLEAKENERLDDQSKKLGEKIEKIKAQLEVNSEDSKLQAKLDKMNAELSKLQKQANSSKNIMSEDAILKIDNLTMQFGGLKAVDSLNFEVKKGEIFGLIGPNGAGKTTVFNCITQFYKATEGDVYFRDSVNEIVHLNSVKVHDVIKHGIVRTFQNVELIWELSILDNMLVGGHSLYRSGFFDHSFKTRKYKHEESVLKMKALKILKDLDLTAYQDFFPLGLPYGILKKVELARTLMSNPSLIILDEPAAGLNEAETIALAETIRKIKDEYACTIFLVEHDMGLVMNICDTICAISFGKKLAIGTPSEIQTNSIVKEAYLGGE